MVAHSAAPQGPTRTWAPSCACQRPLGSASADPALTSTDKTIAETPQTLHHLMCYSCQRERAAKRSFRGDLLEVAEVRATDVGRCPYCGQVASQSAPESSSCARRSTLTRKFCKPPKIL